MPDVVIDKVADASAGIEFLREIAGLRVDGRIRLPRFLEHAAQRNHVSSVVAQPPDRDSLRGDITRVNQARDCAIEFAGELARVAHQFEIGVLHKHVLNLGQDMLVEPIRANSSVH